MEVTQIKLTAILDDVSRNHRVDPDAESIEHLAADIKRTGLINPVTLRKLESGYRIVTGTRRVAACRSLGMESIDAVVRDLNDCSEASIRMAENLLQAALSPVEEALAIASWMQEGSLTIDEAAGLMCRRREWVAGRLEIQGYHPALQGALHTGSIALGACRALARVDDEARLCQMLDYVERTGANASTVAGWVDQWAAERDSPGYEPGEVGSPDVRYAPVVPMTTCALCAGSVRLSLASQVCLCGECVPIMQAVGSEVQDGMRGQAAGGVGGADGGPS